MNSLPNDNTSAAGFGRLKGWLLAMLPHQGEASGALRVGSGAGLPKRAGYQDRPPLTRPASRGVRNRSGW